MPDPIGRQLAVQAIFLVFAVLCTLSKNAIYHASESKTRRAAQEGDKKAEKMLNAVSEPDNFTFAMDTAFLLTAFAALSFAILDFAPLITESLKLVSPIFGALLVALAVSLVYLLFGLLFPMRIAEHKSYPLALSLYPLARGVQLLLLPIAGLFSIIARDVLRLFGINTADETEDVSEDEIRLLVGTSEEMGEIAAEEKQLIEKVFEFNNICAQDIMVHRTDMVVVWKDDTPEEILTTIRDSGLSRFPVCDRDIDDIVGILSTRQWLIEMQSGTPQPIDELLRPAYFVPGTVKSDVLFREMQTRKVHLAIVVDEYGGTSGLLTMEDLLEQLVGEIYDEFDNEEEQEIRELEGGGWRIAGYAELEAVGRALGIDLDDEAEEYDTLGGLIFSRLSVIPEDGSTPEVEAMGMRIKVESICDRRVEWAYVTLDSLPDDPSPEVK